MCNKRQTTRFKYWEKHPLADVLQNSLFLKFRKFDRKTAVLESLFKKSCRPPGCNFIWKRLQPRYFSANFAIFLIFLSKPLSQNISGRLLLYYRSRKSTYLHFIVTLLNYTPCNKTLKHFSWSTLKNNWRDA